MSRPAAFAQGASTPGIDRGSGGGGGGGGGTGGFGSNSASLRREGGRMSPPDISPAAPLVRGGNERDTLNYGARASALISELKRAEWLPEYDHEGVRQVLEECAQLYNEFNEVADQMGEDYQDDKSAQTTFSILRCAIARNKRCLLAYHQYRWDQIQKVVWERGGTFPPHLISKLSASEIQTMNSYLSLTARYQQNLNVMLFSDLQPPKDLMIEVRVMQPAGEIVTSTGDILSLRQGATLFVRRAEVESLIRSASLKQL